MRLPIDIGAPMLFVSELMVANTSVQGYKDARERVARSVLGERHPSMSGRYGPAVALAIRCCATSCER